jgi:pimeloyl-ACP methyl ester carboxylesterase
MQPEIFRALLRTLKEFDFSLHAPERLAALPEGTLVMFGGVDRVVRPVALTERVRAMRDGRLVVLPRVGHLPQVEAADEVTRLLTEYVRSRRVAPADAVR